MQIQQVKLKSLKTNEMFQKRYFLPFLTLLFACNSLFAQDPNYAGPAKMYVTNYYRDAAEAKKLIASNSFTGANNRIAYMEKSVASIKTKDPAYNVAPLESEIADLKNQLAAAEAKETQRIADNSTNAWAEIELNKTLDYLFKDASFHVGTFEDDIQKAKKELEDYVSKTNFVLEKTNSADPSYIPYIQRTAAGQDQYIADKKRLLADVSSKEYFEGAYYEIRLHQAFWDAARKIYPAEKSFESAYQKITSFIAEVGSMEDVAKIAAANETEKIAARKMESPIATDLVISQSFIDLFNAKFSAKYGTVLRCVLLQENWTIERNELTGIVTGRNRAAQIAYKGADGKCYLLSNVVYLYEEFVGDKFINRVLIYNGLGGQEMLCENVKN